MTVSGGDEFYLLLDGTIIDGLGYLSRLYRRSTEFEEMAVRTRCRLARPPAGRKFLGERVEIAG